MYHATDEKNPYEKSSLMNVKVKTSLISIVLTTFFTLFKFLFFFLTGSLAVLSEAWHSFSDIVTSLLVLLAVRRSSEEGKERLVLSKPDTDKFRNPFQTLIKIHPELIISFIIGISLLCVSVSIMRKILHGWTIPISYPLPVGIFFIIFSFGSYFLYKFKTTIGKSEKSAALISDGLHSRADMVSALLTGFSLIMYYLGINIDRIIGGFIALFIFSFAVETLVNVISTHLKKKKEYTIEYRSYEIFAILFKKETYHDLVKLIDSKLKPTIGKSKFYGFIPCIFKWAPRIVIAVLVLAYLSTSLYAIKPDEEAVRERFGRVVNRENFIQPGLHLKLPWPIDKIIKVKTKIIRDLYLGNTAGSNLPLIWTRPHGEEISFVSGDNNLFLPYIVVHYRVKNPYNYLYHHVQPETLLKDVSCRILTETFNTKSFYDLAVFSRKKWMENSREAIQNEIDKLKSGIEIVNFLVKDLHPPQQIASSFEEVVAACQEKQELINRAQGYRKSQLPKARGNAFKEESNALAYRNEKTKKASGKSHRYLSRLSVYERSKNIVRRDLYLKAMKNSLKSNRKVLIDPRVGVPDVWLKSENLFPTLEIEEY